MGYVVRDLDEEDKKSNGTDQMSSGTSVPVKQQGIASVVAPEQTAQQKRGTGFTNLSEWLDAGKGREQSIASSGNQLLSNEKGKFDKSLSNAQSELSKNKVINLSGTPQEALDRAAGISQFSGNKNNPSMASPPAPVISASPMRPGMGISSIFNGPTRPATTSRPQRPTAAQSNSAIGINSVSSPVAMSGPIPLSAVLDGPSIGDVIGQSYNGPSSVDYKAGQDFQDAKMLGNAGTASDVLARDAISRGQYGQGMRALDSVLFGSDSASQEALKRNTAAADTFQNEASTKGAEFEQQAQTRANEMADAAGQTRQALQKIGDDTKTSLKARAEAANALAQSHSNDSSMVMDPNTGKMVPIPKGYTLGDWEGAAVGSANANNVMTDAENKRFAALKQYLGYDAPTKNGEYKEGRRTTKEEKQVIQPGFTNEEMKQAKAIMVKEALQKAKNKGMAPAAILGAIFGGGIPAIASAIDAAAGGRDIENLKKQFSPSQWAELEKLVKQRWGVDETGNVNGWNLDQNGNVLR